MCVVEHHFVWVWWSSNLYGRGGAQIAFCVDEGLLLWV